MNPPAANDERPASLVRLGGALGVAGAIIGLLILLVGCMGFDSALPFSVIPLLMGVAGLPISLAGAFQQRKLAMEDSRVLLSFFVNFIAIVGGLLEMAMWRHWSIFYHA